MKKLKVGIPKGSLEETTIDLLKSAGIRIKNSSRSYFPESSDSELDLMLVRAQEMATFIEDGVIDCGLTGKDWIEETGANVQEVSELIYSKQGLGKVRIVLAAKKNSGISSLKDLEGKTIATEYVRLTKKFLKRNGVNAKVEFSWGATEAKCPRLVDAIVEVTETGSSLRANGLEIVEELLVSSTRLIANKTAWSDAWKQSKIRFLDTMLQGVILGRKKCMLEMNVPENKLEELVAVLPCMRSPTIGKLLDGGYSVKVAVDRETVPALIPVLKEKGAIDILEFALTRVVA